MSVEAFDKRHQNIIPPLSPNEYINLLETLIKNEVLKDGEDEWFYCPCELSDKLFIFNVFDTESGAYGDEKGSVGINIYACDDFNTNDAHSEMYQVY